MAETPVLAVVGAGIAGLTLALAARQAGLEVAIYDCGAKPDPEATVELSPNATRVLHALGLRDALTDVCAQPDAVHLRTWRTGYLVAQRPIGPFSEMRYGAPHYFCDYHSLREVLKEALRPLGVQVLDNRCIAIHQNQNAVTAEFASGSIGHYQALVGCDGAASTIANSIGTATQGTPSEYRCHEMRVAIDQVDSALTTNHNIWLGPYAMLTHQPTADGKHLSCKAIWRESDNQAFVGWHPGAQVLLQQIDDTSTTEPVNHYQPVTNWSDRRITLAGDAAYPITPHLDQGAAMAIEDAWVLALMLERWEEDPASGIAEYQRYRAPRRRRVQVNAERAAHSNLVAGRWQIWKRNVGAALSSRYLPEIAMQKNDWLYGYDCIKGFN